MHDGTYDGAHDGKHACIQGIEDKERARAGAETSRPVPRKVACAGKALPPPMHVAT